MSGIAQPPAAPMGQQVPPLRAAALNSWPSLRAAHGALPLTTGTAYRLQEQDVIDGAREH